jgi:hypothetical protein
MLEGIMDARNLESKLRFDSAEVNEMPTDCGQDKVHWYRRRCHCRMIFS